MKEAFDLVVAGKINNKDLISHAFSIDEINEAFEMQLRRDESLKVLVKQQKWVLLPVAGYECYRMMRRISYSKYMLRK